ncbi:MAG TPA: outer membrane protein assembly factor BamA [Stellaceae bacterium]|nr:outer membrane protein assembly factor BamA [Stellaceae bacterium]
MAVTAVCALFAGAMVASTFPASLSIAQVPSGGTISEIRIEGTQRVEPETVRSYMLVQPGDPFDSERVDKSLKALFATSLFSDVTLRREGDALIVRVVENPIINRIAFEGNHKLTDSSLETEVQVKPRVVYTRTKVQSDVKRILDLYRRNGRFAATVTPKVIPLEQNRVDLVFEIDEGPVTGVQGITFLGNHEFSASRLRSVIQTKESRWYRFFSSDDNYDPDRLTYDRELLRKFYLSQGYADFRVSSAVAELTPSRDGFVITFTIDEGQRYHFGTLDLVNAIKEVSTADLKAVVPLQPGDWYNADQVDKTITSLTEALGNRGYAFVDIQPRVKRNPETRTIDVTFDVKEGPRVFVERIDITGNVRTLDRVIRREFRLIEGDAFNTSKMQRSEQRIRNLGFFKKVDVTNNPGSAPDKTVIGVSIQEQSTGEFSVGVGFSTLEGILGDISIRERNFLGRGDDLRIGTVSAQLEKQIDLSFTEPYFLERNLAAGFDIFAIQQDNQLIGQFNQTSYGTTLRTGYQITEPLRQTLKYTVRQDTINNIQPTASTFIQDEAGTRFTSAIGQVLVYDKRDNRLDPSAGFFVQLATDVAGLGGDVRYGRGVISGGYYYSLAPQWVLGLTSEVGFIKGINDNVRIEDRFFVGGDNLRGFQIGGIGPRDVTTGDALGGNEYYVGSVSLGFPLGLPDELGLTGRIFSDFGSLFGIDLGGLANPNNDQVVNNRALRVSTGVGVSWRSPFGPIRLDLGFPVIKQEFDKRQLFNVNFGTRF